MTDHEDDNAFDRIDRRIGMAWSRLGGAVFGMMGLLALRSAFLSGDTTSQLIIGAAALALLWLAYTCFKSRTGILDLLGDNGPGRKG
ncbi:hypothetical protein [Erythrobacter sp. JK5]|uniref:hypothetical protein n=1 Tax=Erythrobacter sp. JK5 TaxID=2829500 RepID=UPI001BA78535|nr:hypothetical protein [Erythrobacter sp. JK5]QUL38428.1 hypothetical protein KDC96_03170 [Erythrobacter sp. JK5]